MRLAAGDWAQSPVAQIQDLFGRLPEVSLAFRPLVGLSAVRVGMPRARFQVRDGGKVIGVSARTPCRPFHFQSENGIPGGPVFAK